MHAVNAGYTVIARLKEGRADLVSRLLVELRAHPERLPFADVRTTHFATGAVLPEQIYETETLPAALMLATSFSGPSRVHEDELVTVAGRGLRELFVHCEGFPDACTDAELVRFLRAHRESDTFYSGMQHLTRDDVLRQDALRVAIEKFVDDRPPAPDASAVEVQTAIQGFVAGEPTLQWARAPWQPEAGSLLALRWRSVLVMAIALPFLLGLAVASVVDLFTHSMALHVVVTLGWLAIIVALFVVFALIAGVRDAELQQRFVAGRQSDDTVRALAATQCHPVINEMTVVGPIKEGGARPITLRLALWIVARVAEGIFGLSDGINIPTVATARWIAIDGGKRLVFISNFTNAAEPYVRDFIDVRFGAMRINLTFGFGRGYPHTEWIVRRGAVEDPNGFINVVSYGQRRTELWYCPYDNLSIDNIKRNRAIREGLFGAKTEAQAATWLRLLGGWDAEPR